MPTETDNTFQQGQTSSTPITYEVRVTQETKAEKDTTLNIYGTYAQDNTCPPKMCLLIDSTFSIQVQGNGMPPIVDMGAFDITSPVANES